MKLKLFFQWLTRSLLALFIIGSFLAVPNQTTAAKPLSAPFTDCASQTEIPEAECDALVALYTATGGASWTNNSGWLAYDTPCDWYGVDCDAGTNVTYLGLIGNNLTGGIPADIENLTALKSLYLNGNELTSIPAEIGNLTSLTLLWVSYNNLTTGSVPAEIGNLTSLESLDLSGNQLTFASIPAEIWTLTSLKGLELNNNLLTGSIPVEVGNLTSLRTLNLSSNQLTGSIPSEVWGLTSLTTLWLSYNQLTGNIPTEIGNLTSLGWLYLNNNQLTGGIPVEIGSLTSLEELNLSSNQLTGAIPTQFENLTSLEKLELSSNQLTGNLPAQIGNLTPLTMLRLDDNLLSGEIPSSFTNLSNLNYLSLSCGLTSTNSTVISFIDGILGAGWDVPCAPAFSCSAVTQIPTAECNALVALYNATDGENWGYTDWLQTNTPCGWDGVDCDAGTNVTDLYLGWNNLSGTIPPELGSLTKLKYLSLGDNQLSGSIPPELGSLTNLEYLSLGNNQLSGSIPSELGNLTNLRGLYLSSNPLSGSIPTQLGSLTKLTDLYLNNTQLSGEIPASFANLSNLDYLELGCGVTATNPTVISFINGILNPGWDVTCSTTAPNFTMGGTGDDAAQDIAVDSSGNMYIVGYSTATWGAPIQAYNSGTGSNDTFVAKLDSAGNLLWNTFLQISHGWYEAYSIGVDASGNVYISGSDTSQNTYLVKLGTNGNQLWNIPVATGSFAPDMAVAANGNVYIAGSSFQANAIKVDTNGNQVWKTTLSRSDNDCITDIAIDASENAYVTSCSHEIGYPGNFVSKLDINGNLLWNIFSGGPGYSIRSFDITVDASENIYMMGSSDATWGSPLRPYTDSSSCFIAKLDPSGSLQWNTFTYFCGSDMATDASGRIHIVGSEFGATLDTNGNFVWNPSLKGSSITTDNAYTYTVGSTGTPGDIFIRKINSPNVSSITRVGAATTGASSVDFNVTFSKPVLSVGVDDFKLTNTFLTGASITNISGSGSAYTVTVNTGTGNGTIRLDIAATATIQDLDGNPFVGAYTEGQVYAIQKGAAPTVPVLVSPASGALVAGYKPTLDWKDSAPVMVMANDWSYEINVTDGPLETYDQTFNTDSGLSNSSYTFTTSLPVSTTFYWKVRAYNDNNQYSAWSAIRTFSTGSRLDTPVLRLPADTTTENNKRPTFNWDAMPGAASYTLQILRGSAVAGTVGIKAPAHTYTPTVDLLPNTTYTWRVKANNGVNSGDYSDLLTFTTSPNPPKTPLLSLPIHNALLDGAVTQTLKWTPSLLASTTNPLTSYPAATTYEVEYSTSSAFLNSEVEVTTSPQLALPGSTFLSNKTYYWHVRSWSELGATGNHSAWSAIRVFRTRLDAPTLNLPENSTVLNNKRPTFSWDEVPGATSYTLLILKANPKTSLFTVTAHVGTIKAPAYTYTPTIDLLPNTPYTWVVKANGVNAGIYSAPFNFNTSINPPKTPALFAPKNGILVDSAVTQTLTWKPALEVVTTNPLTSYPNALSYDVEYANNPAFANSVMLNVNTTQTSLTLLPGRSYFWRVRSRSALDGAGNYSAWSAAWIIKVKFAAPTLTTPSSGATGVGVRPTFTWTSTNGLWSSYTLQVAPTSAFSTGTRNFIITAPFTTYTIPASLPALTAGYTYYWRVKINGLYTIIPSLTSSFMP